MSAGAQPVPGFVYALPVLFPIFFVGLWLFVTLLLGTSSGWFALQKRFPDDGAPMLRTERWCSGQMGPVRMNGVLTLGACDRGLGIAISKLFGPFQRPLLVPWREIAVGQATMWFMPVAVLRLGQPEGGVLKIDARVWTRLAAASPHASAINPPVVNMSAADTRANRALLLQWLVLTGIAGAAFFLFSRTGPLG